VVVSGAPAQSLPGKTFTLAISDPGEIVPVTAQGLPVANETNIQVTYPISAEATFVSATLSDGSGVGDGATVSEVSDPSDPVQSDVVESIPGPIEAGQTFSLPTLNLTLTASDSVGSTITTGLLDVQPVDPYTVSGDPALTATLQVSSASGGLDPVSETCWPQALDPTVLSTTSVVSVVTTPPAISIATPVSGAVYTVGQNVSAAYECSDVASYGVASCNGPVPIGAAIDTSTVGEQSFTVTTTDLHGTSGQQAVSYYVQAVPTGNVTGPIDAGAVTLASGASCSFGGAACPVQTPPEATYEVTSPVPNGGTLVMGDTFMVQWQIYQPSSPTASGAGALDLNWTIPAPVGTVIDGPVATSDSGLLSAAVGQGTLIGAGQLPPTTGITFLNGLAQTGTGWMYDAVNQPSLEMSWAEVPASESGTVGLYLDVSYTVKVVTPGVVTLPGFPALIGSDNLTTMPVADPNPPVSFDVIDPTPPSASITSPANGAVYSFGQVVAAGYNCADSLVGVSSCVAPVANGAPVDTTSAVHGGLHTFTVTATNSVGNRATTQVEYFVQATPPVANPQTFSVPLGSSANLPILSSDTATDYPLDPASVTIVTPPTDGAAAVNADGSVTFTDDSALTESNFDRTGNLNDSFTYQVSDTAGDESNVTTVSLTVLPQLVITPMDPSSPSLPQGVTLQQPASLPNDPLHSMTGSTCSTLTPVLTGQSQVACGDLAPITITNDGSANSGWTLSGQVSDFVNALAPSGTTCDVPSTYSNECIPGGNLGWAPLANVQFVLPGSAGVVQAGSAVNPAMPTAGTHVLPSNGNDPLAWSSWPKSSSPGSSIAPPAGLHDQSQVLCTSPAGASEGSFTCGASLFLPIPASSAASDGVGYRATLTLTLTLS
jgi:hypothetical protein